MNSDMCKQELAKQFKWTKTLEARLKCCDLAYYTDYKLSLYCFYYIYILRDGIYLLNFQCNYLNKKHYWYLDWMCILGSKN